MGLGGYLTWTAVAREICLATGIKKVMPYEQHGNFIKTIKTPLFENNPYIQQDFECKDPAFPMQLNNPRSNYCKQDTPEKAVQRYDKHIIEQICEFYGIENPRLKCEIYTTVKEKENVDNVMKSVSLTSDFIVIEPQSNNSYTVNKKYPLQKWQFVVDRLIEMNQKVVQIGLSTKEQLLSNVIDLTGKTSFREAAELISRSKLFISSEGGLMHAANAMETKSVILFTGFIHPRMTGYQENKNIWIGKDHGPCGMKIKCNQCEKNAADHDPNELIEAVKELIQ